MWKKASGFFSHFLNKGMLKFSDEEINPFDLEEEYKEKFRWVDKEQEDTMDSKQDLLILTKLMEDKLKQDLLILTKLMEDKLKKNPPILVYAPSIDEPFR